MSKKKTKGSAGGSTIRCYESHPPLPLGDYKVYGGSCHYPVVTDADIYIGLDYGMKVSHPTYPWEPPSPVTEVLYKITDMQPPSDPKSFDGMINWIAANVTAGKKVHIGCVGGHGRTGTVLAALVAVMLKEKDAIGYVRKNYCERAVESSSQIAFLMKHYGVSKAEPNKGHYAGGYTTPMASYWPTTSKSVGTGQRVLALEHRSSVKEHFDVKPVSTTISVWGPSVVFDKLHKPDTIVVIE